MAIEATVEQENALSELTQATKQHLQKTGGAVTPDVLYGVTAREVAVAGSGDFVVSTTHQMIFLSYSEGIVTAQREEEFSNGA